MRVKRYVVDTMPDALQHIRKDLGKDAVILNSKEIRSGGFMGMFSKKKIEVIAAIDANAKSEISTQKKADKELQPNTSTNSNHSNAALATLERNPTPIVKNEQNHLLEEMKQMKKMMAKLTQQNNESIYPIPLENIIIRLHEQDFEESLVEYIVENAIDEYDGELETLSEEDAKYIIRDQLRKLLLAKPIHEISDNTQIAHFVGPTGVGKTTTIAKIAAHQVLKHKKKVGFITSDTYRIAAVEQLKTYANILDIPLEVVHSHQDLVKAFDNLKSVDQIFMDTAGRNYRNEMYVSELNSLLHSKLVSETFLVLSMTMKYQDMKSITTNFSKFKLDKVLFTKMDETETYGAIFNLIHEFGLQASYVANGQNVPDDIVKFNADKIIDLILEEHK